VLCLGGVFFLSISGILGVYAILATFCSLFNSVTLFQLQVYANIRPLKISKWEMCIQLFLDLILDKDKYKLSL